MIVQNICNARKHIIHAVIFSKFANSENFSYLAIGYLKCGI